MVGLAKKTARHFKNPAILIYPQKTARQLKNPATGFTVLGLKKNSNHPSKQNDKLTSRWCDQKQFLLKAQDLYEPELHCC
jgi:hypothetical protein